MANQEKKIVILSEDELRKTITRISFEIIEKVLDDISFNATDRAGETITVDQKYVQDNLGNLVKDSDLSKFIL